MSTVRGRIQRRILSRYESDEMKILNSKFQMDVSRVLLILGVICGARKRKFRLTELF